jgi:two-component system phosphate regulon sensor histidine kinase PhoR
MRRRLFSSLFAPILGVALVAILLFGAAALSVMDGLYAESNSEAMAAAAKALAASLPWQLRGRLATGLPREPRGGLAPGPEPDGLRGWCADISAAAGYRVTIVAADGRVLADSEADPTAMENHAGRPEVAAALAGRTSTARRSSATLGSLLFYAASPIRGGDGAIAGAIRIAAKVPDLEARLKPARLILAAAALAVLAAAVAAAAFFSRRLASPLVSLAAATRAVAGGELSAAIPQATGPVEVADLALDIASMAMELRARLEEAEAEGRERAAILDGMAEAVLALDAGLRIRMANAAARSLFGLGGAEPGGPGGEGLPLLRVTRSTELQGIAENCLATGAPIEAEVSVYGGEETCFRAFAAPLRRGGKGGEGPTAIVGEVIVLDDITRRKRLERVRQDFVANVSHELRTPIQLIKGFTEALADGLAEDGLEDREKAGRFLGIMSRNASRMESLVADLLTLARLEQGGFALKRGEQELRPLIEEAVAAVGPKAERKGIPVTVVCPEGLRASLNAGLFVQALVNLLDNAVKYSPEYSGVKVKARMRRDEGGSEAGYLVVKVSDHGFGIPARDLSRVFERFYRVDKARSRELGGTGLGLAIVKHIALAHGGSVSVESFEGEGSTFSLVFPQRSGPA